jgi:hypothetical protein
MAFERPILNRELPDFVERNSWSYDWADIVNMAGSPAITANTTVNTLAVNLPIGYNPGVRWTVDEALVRIPQLYTNGLSAKVITTISAQLVKYVPEQFAGTQASALALALVPPFVNRSTANSALAVTNPGSASGALIPVSQPIQLVGATGPFGYDPNPLVTTNTYYRPRTSAIYGATSSLGTSTVTPQFLGIPIDPGLAGISPADQPLLASDGTRAAVGGRVFALSDNVMNPYDLLFLRLTVSTNNASEATGGTFGNNVSIGGLVISSGTRQSTPLTLMLRARQRRS